MGERQPLSLGRSCTNSDGEGSSSMADTDDSFATPLSAEQETDAGASNNGDGQPRGASVFQTSLNVSKMCMGTGTLALPFAADRGGLLFNLIGLALIGWWNYYSANCLLRCSQYIPQLSVNAVGVRTQGKNGVSVYGSIEPESHEIDMMPPPPDGTTAYGIVAWYASGKTGLMVLDLLMLMLFFGLLIAYEVAMLSFIADTPITTGSRKVDLLVPSSLVIILSCAPDIGFLSKFSGVGLMAVALSFIVISVQGFEENGCSGFQYTFQLNLWPESLSAASSWFGVVVFGFGVAPFVYNFRDSMADPLQINLSLQIGLLLVYAGYIIISNGIRVLFSPSFTFDGDVLQAMPNTWISLIVRLLMTFVVAVTAPLIVIPCAELIEGKLGIEHDRQHQIAARVLFCIVCIIFAEFVPSGFVNVVAFIGCFCVAIAGFVLPPLFCIQLSTRGKSWADADSVLLCDVGVLILGVIAASVTSTLTFRELLEKAALEKVGDQSDKG